MSLLVPVIVFQDDDLIVSESGLRNLIQECARDDNRLCGIDGRKPDRTNHYNLIQEYGEVPIVLTRCVAFPRELIPFVLSCEKEYEKVFGALPRKNGEDIFLSYAARLFFGVPNLALETDVQCLPAPHSISHAPGHIAQRTEVMRNCQQIFDLP